MHPIWLIVILFAALAVTLTVSEAHKPPPMATRDSSLDAGVLTLGIAIALVAIAIAVVGR